MFFWVRLKNVEFFFVSKIWITVWTPESHILIKLRIRIGAQFWTLRFIILYNVIQKVIAFTVININGTESSDSLGTLNWHDILDSSEKIGNIFIAVEIARPSEKDTIGTADDDRSYVPLLKRVQPKHRVYQSVF